MSRITLYFYSDICYVIKGDLPINGRHSVETILGTTSPSREWAATKAFVVMTSDILSLICAYVGEIYYGCGLYMGSYYGLGALSSSYFWLDRGYNYYSCTFLHWFNQYLYVVYIDEIRQSFLEELISSYNFILVSQLNGSNGEHTGLDDVDSAQDYYNMRRRAHKESLKKQHFARNVASDGKHRVKYGPPDNEEKVAEQITPSVRSHKSIDTLYLIQYPVTDANSLYCLPLKDRFCFGEMLHVSAQTLGCLNNEFTLVPYSSGLCLKVKSHGNGWYVLSSDPELNTQMYVHDLAVSERFIEAYQRRGLDGIVYTIPARKFLIYEPLARYLANKMRSSEANEYLLKACLAIADDWSIAGYSGGMHPILMDTCDFHCALIHHRLTKVVHNTLNQVKLLNNGNIIGEGDNGLFQRLAKYTTIQQYNDAWQIMDQEVDPLDLPLDWKVRTDVTLTPKGVLMTENREGGDLPLFVDLQPITRYSTAFFKFCGFNQEPFITYGPTGNNLTHGLKRLIARRDDEDRYRLNALELGKALKNKLSIPKDVYKSLLGNRVVTVLEEDEVLNPMVPVQLDKSGCYVVSTHYENPSNQLIFELPNIDLARDFIAMSYSRLQSQCNRSTIQKWCDYGHNGLHWAYYSIYERYLEFMTPYRSRTLAASIAHVKKRLRETYVNGVKLHWDDDIMVQSLDANIKRELAKFKKAPRLYVGYGAGSMYAPELPEFVKVCLDGKHVLTRGGITMVINIMAKPRSESLSEIFTDLWEAQHMTNWVYVAIYSDDMCMAGNVRGKSFCWNVDISSNDSSQDMPAFLTLFKCMSNFNVNRAKGLINQCLKPIRVAHPKDPTQVVEVKFDGPFEGSGTVLTTCLNHIGSYGIAAGFLALLSLGSEPSEVLIRSAAALIGHAVTVDDCYIDNVLNFEHVQFLKRSPFRSDGKWLPAVNLGCILRGFGVVEDDLVAKQVGLQPSQFATFTTTQRMELFFSAVIKGWKNEPSNAIMTALRTRFDTSVITEVKHDSLNYVFQDELDQSVVLNDNHLVNRYGLSSDEITELVQHIDRLVLGDVVSLSSIAKIFAVDYGAA